MKGETENERLPAANERWQDSEPSALPRLKPRDGNLAFKPFSRFPLIAGGMLTVPVRAELIFAKGDDSQNSQNNSYQCGKQAKLAKVFDDECLYVKQPKRGDEHETDNDQQ